MRYITTRGSTESVTSGLAIVKGLADNGGLYVPEDIPAFDIPLETLIKLPYPTLAYEILKLFLTDYPDDELRGCIESAYTYPDRFDEPSIAPLIESDGLFFLELFHGRTLAFKDMALSLLPNLLTVAAERERPGVRTVILTATSGDTGKAALAGFAGLDGVTVVVYYPENGVSDMQKWQMVTQEEQNTVVIGVRGNFDDAQTGVKRIFNDMDLAERLHNDGFALSSANSINIGRLLPQIVYYVYAYAQLVKRGAVAMGDPVDFAVPTGNFGNILAGYYAKKMGLPIGTLICASNQNNVLYDFLRTGTYDTNRAFHGTISPSMDILVSSNLERLLYHTSNDGTQVAAMMNQLQAGGRYHFDLPFKDFYASYATEDETQAALRETFQRGYVTDPHTAVAYHSLKQYIRETNSHNPAVILATASPFKFAADVCAAMQPGALNEGIDAFEKMNALSRISGKPVPHALAALRNKTIYHTAVCDKNDMQRAFTDRLFM